MAAPKGNLVVGQSGGPTAVINESLIGVVQEALKHESIEGIYGARNGVEGILREDFIDFRQESASNLEAVAATPGAGLGSCRFKPTEEDCKKIFQILEKYGVRYYFYIGGNDSALSAGIVNKIAKDSGYELRVFHVPKTIDNDLLVTDHCPGYGSAAKYVAQAFMGNDADNRALPGIKIDICMGRNAGWLTAAAALARVNPGDGPHLIYLPERSYTLKQILDDIDAVYQKNKRALVAVSEGVADADGHLFLQSEKIRAELRELGMEKIIESFEVSGQVEDLSGGAKKDAFGHIQLSGSGALADFLSAVVKTYLFRKYNKKARVRADTLGYAQRSMAGVVSEVDALEAREAGVAAVKTAMIGDIDGSICFRRIKTGFGKYLCEPFRASLEDVSGVNFPKGMKQYRPMEDKLIVEAGNDVTPEFIEWARPLLGTLPVKGLLKGVPVKKA
ncbi:MAG: ATP-dependent phosphofructokinase / diphosphate-dependent phosphofructokinase [Candidatus Sumerlaeota bacterium]|nr:ATP-dependent phosphofructokinase / diphosphate-dependent phosphofructokinase [Candidatus Sumerlaeota bacterium]